MTCNCLPTFIFDTNTLTCICPDANSFISSGKCFGCTGIGNGTGNALAKACECEPTYVYSLTLKTCLCPPNSIILDDKTCFSCPTLKGKNSTGAVNTVTGNTCKCNTNFEFSLTSLTCNCPDANSFISSGKCVGCTGIGNGTGNALAKTCECKATYIYSSSSNTCLCPSHSIILSDSSCFICSTLKGKNSPGTVNSTTKNTCNCQLTFVFDLEKLACICPVTESFISKSRCVACENIGNGTGKALASSCACNPTFVYVASANACRCAVGSILVSESCFACSTLLNKNSTGKVRSPTACLCNRNFLFDT